MKRCLGCMEEYADSLSLCPHCGYEEGTLPVEAFHLMPGTMLGERYLVGKVLGFGGFGVTYVGWDTILEKKVAIKEYLPSEFATRVPAQSQVSVYQGEKSEQFHQGMSKFVEEARKLAKFNSDIGIVTVYASFMENNTAYIIMEFLEGESLKSFLERKGKLSIEQVERIILPIMSSLEQVHAEGIIHRDIAPDNIFLTKDGKVKLLDFGAARYASATHSRSLSVIYKPGYAPEEQYQSRGEQGPWTDVYALAATCYKMLTGITPDTAPERRAHDTLKPPSKLGVEIAKNKEIALLNAMNIQVENRTKNTADFRKEWESKDAVVRIIDKVKRMDVGALSMKAKIAIVAGVLVAGLAMVLFATSGGLQKIKDSIMLQDGMVRVPAVVNEEIATAQEKMQDIGMTMEIAGKEYSSEIAKDLILEQNYAGGTVVDSAMILYVTVSAGIRQIYVLDVIGMTETEAKSLLEEEGFLVSVEQQYSSVMTGNVISSSISAGEARDEGTELILYVSKGIDPATIDTESRYVVENLTGKNYNEVLKLLAGKGIEVSLKQEYSDEIEKDIVIAQDIVPGEELKAGSVLTLMVSKGKELIRIPDLQYQEEETACAMLEDIGLECTVQYTYDDVVTKGLVITQSLEVGAEVEKQSVIQLTVSLGKKEIVASNTPIPTKTERPESTATSTPKPTPTKEPKATNTPKPTPTKKPKTTNTPTPTKKPKATNTPIPTTTIVPTREWSEWTTDASLYYDSAYESETTYNTQYRYRDKETTTAQTDTLTGWNWDYTTDAWSEYGAWSEWSTEAMTASDEINVETKLQYQTSTKEEKVSTAEVLDGYTRDDSKTTYGEWSAWQIGTTASGGTSDVREEMPVMEYRYQTKSYTTSTSSSLDGWTLYDTTYTLGDRCEKSTTRPADSDAYTIEEETVTETVTVTKYQYAIAFWYGASSGDYKYCSGSRNRMADFGSYTFNKNVSQKTEWYSGLSYANKKYNMQYSAICDTQVQHNGDNLGWTVDGVIYYEEHPITSTESVQVTYYYKRYKTYTYHFWQWGNWSAWSTTAVSANDTTNVDTQIRYDYRTRDKIYSFYKWSDWSTWTDTSATASDNLKVNERTVYRFRTRQKIYTYHFWRWGAWSNWSAISPATQEGREIDRATTTYYRYRLKE